MSSSNCPVEPWHLALVTVQARRNNPRCFNLNLILPFLVWGDQVAACTISITTDRWHDIAWTCLVGMRPNALDTSSSNPLLRCDPTVVGFYCRAVSLALRKDIGLLSRSHNTKAQSPLGVSVVQNSTLAPLRPPHPRSARSPPRPPLVSPAPLPIQCWPFHFLPHPPPHQQWTQRKGEE